MRRLLSPAVLELYGANRDNGVTPAKCLLSILATHRAALEEFGQLLLRKEVVDRPELQAILKVISIGQARERKN